MQYYFDRLYPCINECTIDLEDKDKIIRVIGDNIETNDVVSRIKSYGFLCEELPD